MQSFDVYLKQRLTEIDVIITQLVQRDSFSMYDLLYLFCSMDEIEVRKSLKIDTSMTIDSQLDNILEIVAEKIRNELYLDVDMELLNQVITSGETEMVSFASELDTIKYSFEKILSDLELSADVNFTSLKDAGENNFDMFLDVDPTNIFYLLTIAG